MAGSGYTSREYVGSIEKLAQISRQAVRDMHLYVLSQDKQRDDDGSTRLVLRSEFDDGTDFRITIKQKKASVALVDVWVGHMGDSTRSVKVLDAISAAYDRANGTSSGSSDGPPNGSANVSPDGSKAQ